MLSQIFLLQFKRIHKQHVVLFVNMLVHPDRANLHPAE